MTIVLEKLQKSKSNSRAHLHIQHKWWDTEIMRTHSTVKIGNVRYAASISEPNELIARDIVRWDQEGGRVWCLQGRSG